MRSDCVIGVFYVLALVAMAALQWAAPVWCGVKIPLVAALAFYVALTRGMAGALVFAFAAGGFCDALSALPGFCTSGWLLAVAAVAGVLRGTDREERRPRGRHLFRPDRGLSAGAAALCFAPVAAAGELWTRLWTLRFDGGTALALLLAAGSGLVAEYLVAVLAGALLPKCGIDPASEEGGGL